MEVTNMRTKTTHDFNFHKKLVSRTLVDIKPLSIGETTPIYIPLIMSGISEGPPITWKESTGGKGIFKNASKCKPIPNNTVTSKNYVDAKKEDNTSLLRLETELSEKEAIIYKGKTVQCTFTHGKLKDPTWGTDSFLTQN